MLSVSFCVGCADRPRKPAGRNRLLASACLPNGSIFSRAKGTIFAANKVMSAHSHYKFNRVQVLVAAVGVMTSLVLGCAHSMPAEDPDSLQAKTVEVPPKDRTATESGPSAANEEGETKDAPPAGEVSSEERIPTESGPTATGEEARQDGGVPLPASP